MKIFPEEKIFQLRSELSSCLAGKEEGSYMVRRREKVDREQCAILRQEYQRFTTSEILELLGLKKRKI